MRLPIALLADGDLRKPDIVVEDDTGDPGDTGNPGDDTGDTGDDTGDDTGNDCPQGVICVDTFPWSGSDDTSTGVSNFDAYACAPSTDESGPEIVYRVQLAEEGFLALHLDGMPSGVDVDVHLLRSMDPDDCIDRGHWDSGALLPAGTYYVVADSWVNDSGVVKDGAYTLTMGHTTPDAFTGHGLREHVLDAALYAFDTAWFMGATDRLEYTLIDFELPSTDHRLWVLDLVTGSLLFDELVTHGEGSSHATDLRLAVTFSNIEGSHQSSIGLIRTSEVYYGGTGRSLRLDGLETGVNDAVRRRAIVLHRGDYATQSFVNQYGYLGRSWGCTVIDPAVIDDIIDTIHSGSLMFVYYPDSDWMNGSTYLAGY
jgi:hypothetical protein